MFRNLLFQEFTERTYILLLRDHIVLYTVALLACLSVLCDSDLGSWLPVVDNIKNTTVVEEVS